MQEVNYDADTKLGSGLKIKTFGTTEILYNGTPIFFDNQNVTRVKSFLQYLIIHRGVFSKPEKIMESLWPDTEYANERKTFQYYVHRIRAILSKENAFDKDFTGYLNIVNSNGSYKLWISPDVELDFDVFSKAVNEAAKCVTAEQLISTTRKLKSIYTGHFMSDAIEEYMVLRMQNYYFNNYCSALGGILKKLSEQGRHSEIVAICEDYFTLDDLDETINCIFIDSLIKMGRNNYAARHYNFIKKKMREVLYIGPSAELQAVYGAMTAKDHETKQSSGDHIDKVSIDMIRVMVDEIVAERLDVKKKGYSFLTLVVNDDTDENDYKKTFEDIMIRALRKKDVYYVLDRRTVIAMLYEASALAYEAIKSRVAEWFLKMCPDANVDITIHIDYAKSID